MSALAIVMKWLLGTPTYWTLVGIRNLAYWLLAILDAGRYMNTTSLTT